MQKQRKHKNLPCINPLCKFYLQNDKVIKRGKTHAGFQTFFCKTCKHKFVETRDTPLFYKHFPLKAIVDFCEDIAEGYSIRSTRAASKHHRDTLGRLRDSMLSNQAYFNDLLKNQYHWKKDARKKLWEQLQKRKRGYSDESQAVS